MKQQGDANTGRKTPGSTAQRKTDGVSDATYGSLVPLPAASVKDFGMRGYRILFIFMGYICPQLKSRIIFRKSIDKSSALC